MSAVHTVLTRRALNRATLHRQLLLDRAPLTAEQAVRHLVGLQAQAPFPPYTGLWTRLAGFRPEHLADLILDRTVVRVALLRGTVHLVTAQDCLTLRPLLQPVLDRATQNTFGARWTGLDTAAVTATAAELLADRALSTVELGRELTARWPDRDRDGLINLVRAALPLVQVPPRAVWGRSGTTRVTTAQHWLGRPLDPTGTLDDLVLRYLRAFGPASVADVRKWCGLTRLAEVLDRLRPDLLVLRDEQGVELFDLPDAPRPDPDLPAPVRFLPDFDNLLLSHADPGRVIDPAHRPAVFSRNGIISATVLVDGAVRAVWRIRTAKRRATLEIEPLAPLTRRDTRAVLAEGERLLAFTAADADTRDIRLLPGPSRAERGGRPVAVAAASPGHQLPLPERPPAAPGPHPRRSGPPRSASPPPPPGTS